jgi:hypothetical protein
MYVAVIAMPCPSSCWTSVDHCCTRGAERFGSTKLMLPFKPESAPALFPLGCNTPLGNGLLSVTVGVGLVCCRRVFCV